MSDGLRKPVKVMSVDEMADRIEALEAILRRKAAQATITEHEPDEMFLLSHKNLLFERDCDILAARAVLAELTGDKDE